MMSFPKSNFSKSILFPTKELSDQMPTSKAVSDLEHPFCSMSIWEVYGGERVEKRIVYIKFVQWL